MKKTMMLITMITGILFITSCTAAPYSDEDRTEEMVRRYSAE